MGNEESTPIDESVPPLSLSGRTLEALAEYIKDGKASKIVVLSGAGISTSAGIPDFRSPETGLYANLAKLNLPFAEAVFDISFFRQTPEPFYQLAHELYPGNFRPTITHSFIRLLNDKGLLLMHFTQNIDCLDRQAGVPDDKIVEAHGSFAKQSCIECKESYPDGEMREHVAKKMVPRCQKCNGLVKPEIVFFGEALPAAFFHNRTKAAEADLLLVMGSSLTVQPFASLPGLASEGVPRVLLNLGPAGGLGSRADDVLLMGDCDSQIRKLAKACGWLDELEQLWAHTEVKSATSQELAGPKKTRDEQLQDEVDKLTKEIDESLRLSQARNESMRNEVEAMNRRHARNTSTSAAAASGKATELNTSEDTSNTTVDSKNADAGADSDKASNDKPKI